LKIENENFKLRGTIACTQFAICNFQFSIFNFFFERRYEHRTRDLEMDVLLVGAGPANLACALHLTKLIAAHNQLAQADWVRTAPESWCAPISDAFSITAMFISSSAWRLIVSRVGYCGDQFREVQRTSEVGRSGSHEQDVHFEDLSFDAHSVAQKRN